jgi:hypothetical protein
VAHGIQIRRTLRGLGFRLDPVKLLQIDRHENDVENDHRIDVREKTVNDEQIAAERLIVSVSRETRIPLAI